MSTNFARVLSSRNPLALARGGGQFRLFFAGELKKLGKNKFLNLYFNSLAKGISSAAYHCLIRLAYGVDSDNDEEIVSGMSYLADAYLELHGPLPNVSASGLSLTEQMNFISEDLAAGRLILPELKGIIFQKMNAISQPEVLADVSKKFSLPAEVTLKDFADVALNLYLTTKDFTTLHTVTSTHASRIIMPYVDDETLYLKFLHQAFVAAYLSIGAPRISNFESSFKNSNETTIIENIETAAQKAEDDHDIKLTYTALEEHRAYGNNLYLRAAFELYPQLQQIHH